MNAAAGFSRRKTARRPLNQSGFLTLPRFSLNNKCERMKINRITLPPEYKEFSYGCRFRLFA